MNEYGFWNFISDHLHMQRPVMLVTVVDYEKGSPGKTGFKLAVSGDETRGTIGGGIMEFNIINLSKEFISINIPTRLVKKLVHSLKTTVGEPSGLICAGSETICMISLLPGDAEIVDTLLSALKWHAPAHLSLSPAGLSFHMGKQNTHHYSNFTNENEWIYRENTGAEYSVYIIGGGHVGLAVARVMQSLDFNVTLIDDREDAPAMIDPSLSIHKIFSPYDGIGQHIEDDVKSFVVIVTSAMQSDKAALQQVLQMKCGYLGLMGTPAKISRIFSSLSEEEQQLAKRIHAPIGIDIQSKTSEEIAVSIAAELIKVKNEMAH